MVQEMEKKIEKLLDQYMRNSAMRRRLHQMKIVTPPDGCQLTPPVEEGVTIKSDVSMILESQ